MKLVDILKAKTVASFTIHEHGLCIVGLSADYGLSAECLVRFIGADGSFFTVGDHGHQFGRSTPFDAAAAIEEKIKGRVIDRASIREETNDLTLFFGSDCLEIICDSCGYEAYNLRGPNNLIVVAHGGREAPISERSDSP
jgi:hypothetical protein